MSDNSKIRDFEGSAWVYIDYGELCGFKGSKVRWMLPVYEDCGTTSSAAALVGCVFSEKDR